jgi:hypothetical protein
MMKRIWILPFTVVFAVLSFAQEETLVGGELHSGGYGGPVWKVGFFDGRLGLLSGGRGGWIINHKVAIGGGGYSLLLDVKSDAVSSNGRPLYIDMTYGGFEIEYIHDSDRLIHWTIHALLGTGTVKTKVHDPVETVDTDAFYIVEPSMNFDFNMARWFRIGFGFSYRLAFGVDLEGISSSDIHGLSGLVIFKFGRF